MTKRLKRNQFYFSKNALKLTYGNVAIQKFFRGYIPGPPFRGREEGKKTGWGLGRECREWCGRGEDEGGDEGE
jgi:hypothetical protein